MFNLLIMRILLPNPFPMLSPQFIPNPVSKVRIKFSVRMEPITRFDHSFGVAAFHNFSLENLHRREVVVNHIEIFVGVFVDNFLVDFAEIVSAVGCKFADGFVAVEPTPTRTDF